MDVQQFEAELRARGGEAEVWLVHAEDAQESLIRGAPALKLQRAFWTRGAAYAFAHAAHEERRWQHYHVLHLLADAPWVEGGDARTAEFETTFGRSRELPSVVATASELAAVLEAAR